MKRRLRLMVLAVTATVTLAFLISLGVVVKVVATDRATSLADQEARALASVLASRPTTASLTSFLTHLNSEGNGEVAAVFLSTGKEVGPDITAPSAQRKLAEGGTTFRGYVPAGTNVWVPVRVGTVIDAGVVFIPNSLLDAGVVRAWLILFAVGLLVLLIALAVSDRLSRTLVQSIEELEAVTLRLSKGELTARVEEPPQDKEIANVGRAVNILGDRISELLTLEREEAADLSHRLRTSLTALLLETETLSTEEDKQRMQTAVHDLNRAVDAVIEQVRHARRAKQDGASDLASISKRCLEFWAVLADDQNRVWNAIIPDEKILVTLPESTMSAAIDVLIENVMSHTPAGTNFGVHSKSGSDFAILIVEDEGPGFPKGPVLARGHSDTGSTGLGLDIVRRTAERTGGFLLIGNASSGGARVEAHFARKAANSSLLISNAAM